MPSLRAAVFASGNGTNAENILRHCRDQKGIDIAVIITDQPYAGVIERAKKFDVPCEVVARKVGELTAFTVAGTPLDADALAKCNTRAK